MKLKTQNARYITASILFSGRILELFDLFSTTDPNVSWGDANLTLVDARFIVDHLEQLDDAPTRSIQALRKRIEQLPGKYQCYVDLEN